MAARWIFLTWRCSTLLMSREAHDNGRFIRRLKLARSPGWLTSFGDEGSNRLPVTPVVSQELTLQDLRLELFRDNRRMIGLRSTR